MPDMANEAVESIKLFVRHFQRSYLERGMGVARPRWRGAFCMDSKKFNKLIVKYGSLIGLAFMINILYSGLNDLSVNTFYSLIRTFLFSVILLLGAAWTKVDFDNLDKN